MADNAWSVDAETLVTVFKQLDLVPSTIGVLSGQFVMLELLGKNKVRAMLSSLLSGSFILKGGGEWPFDEKINLDRRLLFPFVQVGENIKSKAPFEFRKGKKEVTVKHGRRNARFGLTSQVAGYGTTPGVGDGFELSSQKEFWELIRCLRTCASTDPTVPHLNCVYLAKGDGVVDLFASNEYIAAWATHKIKHSVKQNIAFPLYLLEKVGSDGMKRIICQEKQVVLEFENGVLWEQMSAKAISKFPHAMAKKRFLETQAYPRRFSVPSAKVGLVCKRLETYLAAVNRKDWVLVIEGTAGSNELRFTAEVPQGIFKELVRAEKSLASDAKIVLPLSALMTVFEYMSDYEDGLLTFRFKDKGSDYRLDTRHIHLLVGRKAE